jgi:carotenoid cleavage dioxygenase-like enzyme
MSAHPHGDFSRGRIVNVATQLGPSSSIIVYEHAPHERRRRVVGRWSPRRLPYVHSFGLTPRHALLVAHPFSVNPISFLWSNAGFINHFRWRPSEGTRIIDIERETGRIREYETENMFVFHVANAFEDSDGLVLDLLANEDTSFIERTRVRSMERQVPDIKARFLRLRLQPGQKRAIVEPLTDVGFEFPCINYRRFSGASYQWCWGASNGHDRSRYRSAVVKIDLHTGNSQHFEQDDWIFGEPLFVARPGATEEDDGVLVSVATRARETASALVVFDAATLEPRAWAEVPVSIPLGFHGSFFLEGGHSRQSKQVVS